MFKKILVPLDGSDLAEKAIGVAEELGEKFDGEIILMQAMVNFPQPGHTEEDLTHDRVLGEIRKRAYADSEGYLAELGNRLRAKGLSIKEIVVEGRSPAEAILDQGEGLGIDAIVMSTHGRSGLTRWVFGSVAEKVLRGAKVPVVLIRDFD